MTSLIDNPYDQRVSITASYLHQAIINKLKNRTMLSGNLSGNYSKNNYSQKETVEIIATNTGIDIHSIIPLPEFLQVTEVMDNNFHLTEKYEHLGIIRV